MREEQHHDPGIPVLELTYQERLIGWIDSACAITLLDPDTLWLNLAIAARFGA